MALTRHWDTCSSNPAFFPFVGPFLLHLIFWLGQVVFLDFQFKSARLGNPKAAAHVAVVLVTVKL